MAREGSEMVVVSRPTVRVLQAIEPLIVKKALY
jgi:hypothetical protein